MKIAVLPGDGIGKEIVAQAVKVLDVLKRDGAKIEMEYGHIGGAGYDADGDPLPESTLKMAKAADAVLLGAVGGPQWDDACSGIRSNPPQAPMNVNRPNHALQRTAAGRRSCGRRASWPTSLSLGGRLARQLCSSTARGDKRS